MESSDAKKARPLPEERAGKLNCLVSTPPRLDENFTGRKSEFQRLLNVRFCKSVPIGRVVMLLRSGGAA